MSNCRRGEQIAHLQPAEQQSLLRKQERFHSLPPAEQERLRTLQATIDADPHADKLQRIGALSRMAEDVDADAAPSWPICRPTSA